MEKGYIFHVLLHAPMPMHIYFPVFYDCDSFSFGSVIVKAKVRSLANILMSAAGVLLNYMKN